eukprot:TRINITY_DN9805_c0_g1_i1.p1 TRINITY_DN9805_c0_g1~~TRINITY_DN9805_c0_g1_i1.p1  ORF type:complete len:531 (-),score=119.00 TRINITY_DN9805_c0_g1_i1:453-2045(-)
MGLGVLWKGCSTIQLPKQLIIENARLGLLLRVLQLSAALFVFYNLIGSGGAAWTTVLKPTGLGISVWRDFPTTAAAAPSWCSAAALEAMGMSDGTYDYKPTRCKKLAPGESLLKVGTQLYFPTFVWDYFVEQAASGSCGACNGTGQTLEDEDGECQCTTMKQYLARDVDRQLIVFNHGYQVHLSDEKQSATSTADASIVTIFKPSDRAIEKNMECKIGGKSRHGVSPSGIRGTVEEFLACAGVRLNEESSSPGVHTPTDTPHHPSLRLSGVVLKMTLNYKQRHSDDHDGVVCEVTITADEVWNTMNSMAYTDVPDPDTEVGSYRYRYMYGVSFNTEVVGTFHEFDYNQLITFLCAQLVILGLPPTIVSFVALYLVGVLSHVYQTAANQKLIIKKKIAGFCTRLMGHTQTFKKITGQESVDFEMSSDDLTTVLQEVFSAQVKNGMLCEKEVEAMASTVMEHLDKDGGGVVTAGEFLEACSANEDISVSAVAKLFDKERSRGIGEVIFGNLNVEAEAAPADLKATSVVPSDS